MNAKNVSIIAICVAVIVAGISGVVISMQRADAARAAADKAASEETIATKKAREAELERATAAQNAREAEAKAESEKAALAAAEAENEKLKLENQNLAEKRALAAEERAKADAEAKKAADLKAAKDAELKTAKENADAERAKEAAAADELARAEATKAIREAETLKLKVSMAELAAEKQRYEELTAELLEYQKELDERERALRPEKTIADVSWLPDEDIDIDENGRPRPRKKEPKLPENDPMLPKETRELAKANRIRAQADDILAETSRTRVVAPIEKLYVAALKEGRIVDAEYYRAVLKSMYPDWEYKGENNE
jgi:flagellar biosynthesis GTPase FlhF